MWVVIIAAVLAVIGVAGLVRAAALSARPPGLLDTPTEAHERQHPDAA